jgi:hypothetical protein
MEPIQCSETSAISTETPGKHLKEIIFHLTHGESLKSKNDRMILANDKLDAQIFNAFITILYMYMFRAISCSSSGGQTVLIQHLVLSLSVSDRPVHSTY